MYKRKNRLLNNFIIFIIGKFGAKALVFLMLPLYTSILTTSQYGDIDLITTTASLLLPIVTLGMSEAIFRFSMGKKYDKVQVLFTGVVTGILVFSLVAILLTIANFYIRWTYLSEMLLLLFTSILYEFFSNYIKATGKSVEFVLLGIIQTCVAVIGNILFLAYFRMGIKGYILAYAISYVVPVFYVLLKEKLCRCFRLKLLEGSLFYAMLKYSFPLIFSALSWWVIMASDRYMIRFFLGSSFVGLYSVASKVPTIMQTFIGLLQTSCQLTVNEMYEMTPGELKIFFKYFTGFCQESSFICGSILLILCQPIMFMLAKNDFYTGWIYVPFLVLAIIFSMASGMVSTLYGAYKQNRGALFSSTLGAMINIILNLLLIPLIGITGATIATALSRLFITIYCLIDTKRFLDFDRGYLKIAVNGIVLTLQAVCLITFDKYRYGIQICFLFLILTMNRSVFHKLRGLKK